jgi:uncharacterized membrane protein YphA (DoxX/SURF4 family)
MIKQVWPLICVRRSLTFIKTDRAWNWVQWGVAGIGTVAGGVLIASGLGAPVGAALITASTSLVTGAAVVEGAMAYDNYMDAKMRERGVDNTIMETT